MDRLNISAEFLNDSSIDPNTLDHEKPISQLGQLKEIQDQLKHVIHQNVTLKEKVDALERKMIKNAKLIETVEKSRTELNSTFELIDHISKQWTTFDKLKSALRRQFFNEGPLIRRIDRWTFDLRYRKSRKDESPKRLSENKTEKNKLAKMVDKYPWLITYICLVVIFFVLMQIIVMIHGKKQ